MQRADKQNFGTEQRKFFDFSFFKVDPSWRWIDDTKKEDVAKKIERIIRRSGIRFRCYATIGLRDDTGFLFWLASDSIEKFQEVMTQIYHTSFGRYIFLTHVYLSSTRHSFYAKSSGEHGWLRGEEQKKYVIVYPFIKKREWYLLSAEKRREMMNEHIEVGRKYPEITLNTTYSFGIHDQDFMLAFETDDLHRFQDLIMDLRDTKVSGYVITDTPMIVGIRKDIPSLVKSLG